MGQLRREVAGHEVVLDVRDGSALDEVVVREVFDERTYEWTPESLVDACVLDIGANIGAFTTFAAACGARWVRAVEPDLANFTLLEANAKRIYQQCDTKRIDCIAVAAGPTGHLWLRSGEASTWTSPDEHEDTVKVEAVPLQDLLLDMGDVVVKVDIEAGEYALVESADPACWAQVSRLAMEFHAPPPGPRIRPWPERGAFGRMVETLAEHLRIRIVGRPTVGGLLWGERF